MIDPLLGLTFNLEANPGTYAVLVGSGISRSASIPTGWEVTLDLVRKLASLSGDESEIDPAAWYVGKFGRDPDYAELLQEIAPTSAAQQQLLRSYFEPSDEDREAGRKLPTAAHKAIADLVKSGLVRVVVTTNFDRLMEAALEGAGIAPTVISSADMANGATPLAHSACTVVKLHGDYLDTRCKNSPDALAHYEPKLDALLDRILDEYGLIVSGWSADYDTALRAAFARAPARRYPTYWTHVGALSEHAESIVKLRAATAIKIDGADKFFADLAEKSKTLAEFSRPHPLSRAMAVATLKRFIPKHECRIQLWDLLVEDATRCEGEFSSAHEAIAKESPTKESLLRYLKAAEGASEITTALGANLSYFGEPTHRGAVAEVAKILWFKSQVRGGGFRVWLNLRKYCLLRLIYAVGIAAVVSENFHSLSALANLIVGKPNSDDGAATIASMVHVHDVMSTDVGNQLIMADGTKYYTPVSDYLSGSMKGAFDRLIVSDESYEAAFDKFEYLWALLSVDAKYEDPLATSPWFPFGRYIWRARDRTERTHVPATNIRQRLSAHGQEMPELKAGLFRGDARRLASLMEAADKWHQEAQRHFW